MQSFAGLRRKRTAKCISFKGNPLPSFRLVQGRVRVTCHRPSVQGKIWGQSAGVHFPFFHLQRLHATALGPHIQTQACHIAFDDRKPSMGLAADMLHLCF